MSGDIAHTTEHRVTFGDCDPAGILFYPHHFRFMDATFQDWLRALGTSQADLRRSLDAVGTGLIEAGGSFRAPVHDGDALHHALRVEEWGERTLRLACEARVGERTVFDGWEVRGLFVRGDGRLRLAPLAPLRAMLDPHARERSA